MLSYTGTLFKDPQTTAKPHVPASQESRLSTTVPCRRSRGVTMAVSTSTVYRSWRHDRLLSFSLARVVFSHNMDSPYKKKKNGMRTRGKEAIDIYPLHLLPPRAVRVALLSRARFRALTLLLLPHCMLHALGAAIVMPPCYSTCNDARPRLFPTTISDTSSSRQLWGPTPPSLRN